MITYNNAQGSDIFQSNAQVLVCPANRKGLLDDGIATQFVKEYPNICARYINQTTYTATKNVVSPATFFTDQIVMTDGLDVRRGVVCFLTTHEKPGMSAEVDMIQESLSYLKNFISYRKVKHIAIPALGCGLGGLSWDNDVHPVLLGWARALEPLETIVELYQPHE